MANHKVYCEVEFLKSFVDSKPTVLIPTEEVVTKYKFWINTFEFIIKSKISFDKCAEFSDLAKENELFLLLWKKSILDPSRLEFLETEYPNLELIGKSNPLKKDKELTSVYLTMSDKSICEQVQKSNGVLIINLENIKENKKLYDVNFELIESGDKSHTNWNFLSKYKHDCNSLCIVDNYLLNSTESIEKNLIPILDKLLPKKLKVPFHISIFTLKRKKATGEVLDYGKISRDLYTTLKLKRPYGLYLNIGIFNSNSRDLHDRIIISNNMIIDSGSGFDLFKYDENLHKDISIHKTRVTSFFYHLNSNVNFSNNDKQVEIFEFVIEKLKDIYNKEKKRLENKGVEMRTVNRLLESY